ncbi:hypothetical protein MANES_15G134350v8 [Manihot esculenta]|uniref:Uncharacterized protein n=1 Tax=Manihot esculenta TaxID=3983 RepID=A0ACB7GCX0_MANES|nr:hypothetical protein MANES_15G134350v8 [Manihot esculenta]
MMSSFFGGVQCLNQSFILKLGWSLISKPSHASSTRKTVFGKSWDPMGHYDGLVVKFRQDLWLPEKALLGRKEVSWGTGTSDWNRESLRYFIPLCGDVRTRTTLCCSGFDLELDGDQRIRTFL